jgi:hypothetical protein
MWAFSPDNGIKKGNRTVINFSPNCAAALFRVNHQPAHILQQNAQTSDVHRRLIVDQRIEAATDLSFALVSRSIAIGCTCSGYFKATYQAVAATTGSGYFYKARTYLQSIVVIGLVSQWLLVAGFKHKGCTIVVPIIVAYNIVVTCNRAPGTAGTGFVEAEAPTAVAFHRYVQHSIAELILPSFHNDG